MPDTFLNTFQIITDLILVFAYDSLNWSLLLSGHCCSLVSAVLPNDRVELDDLEHFLLALTCLFLKAKNSVPERGCLGPGKGPSGAEGGDHPL